MAIYTKTEAAIKGVRAMYNKKCEAIASKKKRADHLLHKKLHCSSTLAKLALKCVEGEGCGSQVMLELIQQDFQSNKRTYVAQWHYLYFTEG